MGVQYGKRTGVDTEEAHDFVPMTLWALLGACVALFWYSLSLCPGNTLYYHVASPLPLIIIMARTHYSYMKSKHQYYRQKVAMWSKIYAAMQKAQQNRGRNQIKTGKVARGRLR
jgi:hypothetical protein